MQVVKYALYDNALSACQVARLAGRSPLVFSSGSHERGAMVTPRLPVRARAVTNAGRRSSGSPSGKTSHVAYTSTDSESVTGEEETA